MGDLTESMSSPSPAPLAVVAYTASEMTPQTQTRTPPVREDCWSEEATATLVDAWGSRYVELNRGNLRQKDWQDVADAVNRLHGHTKKTFRTDVQCKNRIDTIKKKYKLEKSRVESSNGTLTSSWIFFDKMDSLIGSSVTLKKPSPPQRFSPPLALPATLQPPSSGRYSPPVAVPLPLAYKKAGSALATALPQKRGALDEGFFRRNYSTVAAAAAAAENESEDDDEEEEAEEEEEEGGAGGEEFGISRLARAIEGFGEVYERVEAEKLRQMVELEKKRMQFAKELEEQRMRMFMDTQVQLERIKRNKRSTSNDLYS